MWRLPLLVSNSDVIVRQASEKTDLGLASEVKSYGWWLGCSVYSGIQSVCRTQQIVSEGAGPLDSVSITHLIQMFYWFKVYLRTCKHIFLKVNVFWDSVSNTKTYICAQYQFWVNTHVFMNSYSLEKNISVCYTAWLNFFFNLNNHDNIKLF
jgi:hypothetical protein